jgi:antitoxin PrlF
VVLLFIDCNGAFVESAITIKGQTTIPKAIREYLGLEPGDRLKFFLHPDGSVVLLPKLPSSALRGMIKSRRRRPVTLAQMAEAAAEGAAGARKGARR